MVIRVLALMVFLAGWSIGMVTEASASGLTEMAERFYRMGRDALSALPALEDAELADSWAGLYSITPDHHAILGGAARLVAVQAQLPLGRRAVVGGAGDGDKRREQQCAMRHRPPLVS